MVQVRNGGENAQEEREGERGRGEGVGVGREHSPENVPLNHQGNCSKETGPSLWHCKLRLKATSGQGRGKSMSWVRFPPLPFFFFPLCV